MDKVDDERRPFPVPAPVETTVSTLLCDSERGGWVPAGMAEKGCRTRSDEGVCGDCRGSSGAVTSLPMPSACACLLVPASGHWDESSTSTASSSPLLLPLLTESGESPAALVAPNCEWPVELSPPAPLELPRRDDAFVRGVSGPGEGSGGANTSGESLASPSAPVLSLTVSPDVKIESNSDGEMRERRRCWRSVGSSGGEGDAG